ncbi:pyruvate/2-oxoglutarate dehydrogenase complex dihydrolipoamide dehydrogenase (E3) component [Caldalkalibacillus uzonensis]|uniref:Pyruvate/2-oxoglutarate dehydrogenase complex dihydrolipoamide dehydrogenase (E3) component n=1 Tax=Caldalkalibacillus uzonensis TaxID=353224 RepID=A0ABU0CM65_9BACI|nr:NAD(P)/FAD-dependent oxidoreductase [Caldalkalibacillus uzonensis]MDQ0337511.1 pyruvate/2-oxoglutarate dehydrogenase complex dihydrolipoamide dehydrogenase (E3) component [Caldalkalibacillus uzonensis]
MPKKALVRAMEVWETVNKAEVFGAEVKQKRLNWQKVMQSKDEWIGKFVGGKEPYLSKQGVDLVYGEAKFIDGQTLQVGSKTYTADKILIGVGSRPNMPPIEGTEYAKTNRELLTLPELPESLVIIGGGVIGLEFAHIYHAAGVKVTILQRGNVLLKGQDRDSSEEIRKISEEKGIDVMTNTNVHKITKESDHYVVHFETEGEGHTLEADEVVMAAGRKPDIEGLDLDKAGIDYDENGVKVNPYLQTVNERVYAAGDCIGGLMLTPVASYEAKLAVRNAFRGNREKVDYTVIPHTVFTIPQVATVGLTEDQAREKGIDYIVQKTPFKHNGTAILLGETDGFIKLMFERQSGKIIGAHIVGVEAGELIHQIAIAMKGNMTVYDLASVVQVHPTLSEGLILLAQKAVQEISAQSVR